MRRNALPYTVVVDVDWARIFQVFPIDRNLNLVLGSALRGNSCDRPLFSQGAMGVVAMLMATGLKA